MIDAGNAYNDDCPVILITGANGQLGTELRHLEDAYPGFRFLFTGRAQLPIENKEAVTSFFENRQIQYCINCAAYTAVDKAESEKDLAYLINATAVGHLAAICKAHHCQLIHISTDYVFDGKGHNPRKEEDAVAPLNVYGASKLRGEELAFEFDAKAIVVRTSWVYSAFGNNFVKTMLRLFHEKETLNIVSDQLGSPTYTADLAKVILTFIEQHHSGKRFSGIYHYSNYGITSWFHFASYIKELTGASCILNPVPTSAFPTQAVRPQYSVLDTSRISAALKITPPFWKDSLRRCLLLLTSL